MTRKTRAERQSEHADAVKQEAGRLLLLMDRKPDQHMHLDEHRRRAVREGDTVSVEAIDRVYEDGLRHNAQAGPSNVRQAKRDSQRRASEDARRQRERCDQEKVSRLVEQGRSRAAGIRPNAFGESGGEHNPGLQAPTKRRNRGSGRPPYV